MIPRETPLLAARKRRGRKKQETTKRRARAATCFAHSIPREMRDRTWIIPTTNSREKRKKKIPYQFSLFSPLESLSSTLFLHSTQFGCYRCVLCLVYRETLRKVSLAVVSALHVGDRLTSGGEKGPEMHSDKRRHRLRTSEGA